MPKQGYQFCPQNSRAKFFVTYGNSVDKFDSIMGSAGDFTENIKIREPYTRSDYEDHRPGERIPKKLSDVIKTCRAAYYGVGVVRNVFDLMTDFVVEDFTILHKDKDIEIWFKTYYRKIGFKKYIEEFVRHFLLDANSVTKRVTAILTKPVEKDMLKVAMGSPDIELRKGPKDIQKSEIPWRYVFLDPCNLEWTGGEAARISGQKQLAFKLSRDLINIVNHPKDQLQKDIVKNLPADFVKAVKDGKRVVPLDMSKIYVAHNKKDSWEDWATPHMKAILKDIIFKEKLRLAEMSALDGVINVIRLWKLGDHKERIFPDEGAIEKLLDILQGNTGGGALDIVWDSMISMEAFYPPIDKILGSDKYVEVDHDILVGLGIPEVLLGGKGANFSNSFIQLKTLVERLEAARDAVSDWIEHEIDFICRARGYDTAPVFHFRHMNLQDENVTRQLILGLFDRGILSPETLLSYFGEYMDVESARNPVQRKEITKNGVEILSPFQKKELTPGGRPSNTKDVSRKSRQAKPRTSVNMSLFALETIDRINDVLTSKYLKDVGIENARQLSNKQKQELQTMRISVLSCINPLETVSDDMIIANANKSSGTFNDLVNKVAKYSSELASQKGVTPTFNEIKQIEGLAWLEIKGDNNG